MQFHAIQALSPVWNERAMRGAGNRVFGDTGARREEAGDKIAACARRGHDDSERVEARKDRQIRRQVSNLLFRIENREVISRFRRKDRRRAEAIDQFRRSSTSCRWTRWKIELEKVFSPRDGEFAGAGLKTNRRRTKAKAAASRRNGAKGGRPPKRAVV